MDQVAGSFGFVSHELPGVHVDEFGLPTDVFGGIPPKHCYAVVGRSLAVSGSIEYLRDRLGHLPEEETKGEPKIAKFNARWAAGRNARNAVVHSQWIFGADMSDPNIILGIRYKVRVATSGTVATLAISEVADSEREHDVVRHTMTTLRNRLRADIATLTVGQQAYAAVMLRWGSEQWKRDSSG